MEHSFEELKPKMKKPLSKDERFAEVQQLLKRNCYGSGIADTAMKKYLSVAETSERRQLIEKNWSSIQAELKKQIVPFEKLRLMLKTANCPVRPAEIGLDREQYFHAVHTAQLIRIRSSLHLRWVMWALCSSTHRLVGR